jgi:hypothetical protein
VLDSAPMPARSTPFQELVHHIQEQLSGGVTVVQSEMLLHRLTGAKREVDVVIRTTVGEHPVIVSIECLGHARPADVTWVERMHGKHEHLDTNRLVLVSRAGFSRDAMDLADKLGIATYTPERACDLDWTKMVGRDAISLSRFDFTPLEQWLEVDAADGRRFIAAGDPTRMVRSDESWSGTLGEFVSAVLHGPEFADPAMGGLNEDMIEQIYVDSKVADGIMAEDTAGRRHVVTALRVRVRAERRTSRLELRSVTWKGTPAGFASGNTVLGDTTMTIVEKEPGHLDARIIVDGRTIVMRTPASVLESPDTAPEKAG